MNRDDDGNTPGDDVSAAETRVVEDDPSLMETVLATEGDASAETVVTTQDVAQAETVVTTQEDAQAETVVTTQDVAQAETVVATDAAADEDQTQLVQRESASVGASEPATAPDGPADAAAPTKVLSPTAPATPAASGPGGTRRLPDTRVLEEEADKTSPPRVEPAAPPAPPARRAAPTPIDPDRGLAPGTVLFGEYEIVNVLGVGGMGEVYRARHRRLDEHRAIKVMHAELSKKKGASEFFYREAKALLAVRHPAVVHCHDLLSDDQGRVYLIMEMIEGIPLSKKMNDGPLSPDEVAVLGARVSHGLAAAHRKGVIHRDVSPDNIVLPNGRVQEAKIIDFGIAKLLDAGEGTIVDGFKGKLSYASPEQLGFHGGKIDGRSDFYSLGLVLVAAALGRPLSMGTTVVEAVDARRGFKKLPDAIPMGLSSAIMPLLALDPNDRPKYVDRLFVVPGGVEGATDPGPISTGGAGAAAPTPDNRVALFAGLAAGVALVVGGGMYLGLGGGDTAPATTATPVAPAQVEPRADQAPPAVTPAAPIVEEPKPVVVEKKPPAPRRITARDRLKIIGLLGNAKSALADNRLMTPPGNNAFDKYTTILEIDPKHQAARDGLREIATRYVAMADRAIGKDDLEKARTFVERARRADASYPGIGRVESRLGQ